MPEPTSAKSSLKNTTFLPPLIEMKDICFAYEEQIALRHVDLTVNRGECVILMGPNGCGKSTLLKLLNGLLYPNQGTYLFEGKVIDQKTLKNPKTAKAFHQKVGFIFQNADLQLFCSSVTEEIAFGPMQMGLSQEVVNQRVDDMLRLLGIEHLRDRAPYHLSGGEKRKVSLACILSMNPSVLVLDEPIAGLDRKTSAWLLDFLKTMKQAGKTLIIATHNDALAQALGDRIIEMEEA